MGENFFDRIMTFAVALMLGLSLQAYALLTSKGVKNLSNLKGYNR